jgi:hypothetical protein
MRTSDAKAAEEFEDSMGRVKSQLKMAAFQVGAPLAPALMELAGWITTEPI